jgi:hypothetical protein
MSTITSEPPGLLSQAMIERISNFQKIIPFVIGAVAIGVCTVNRTIVKSLIHLGIAVIAGLVASTYDFGVTAFLFSTIGYIVACCLVASGNVDIIFRITMPIGFTLLCFIDIYVKALEFSNDPFPTIPYVGIALLSAMWGIAGSLSVKFGFPKKCESLLYDFKGCSCDDCANANSCPANNGPPTDNGSGSKSSTRVVMGRILNQCQ